MPDGKAHSCLETGELDGWEVATAFGVEMDPSGSTRLCATADTASLPAVHRALIGVLKPPLSFLYRQKINRADPQPEGHPGRDFVALELSSARVIEALQAAPDLIYKDARCEVWIRGGLKEQVVLDRDGTLYCYPDDPVFRDALKASGLEESDRVETLEGRDYVRHWFRAVADEQEATLIRSLALAEVPVQK